MRKPNEQKSRKADKPAVLKSEVSISYFTDPLCAWSWAFEPELVRLKNALGDRLQVIYHMGGLIPDWTTFNDAQNSVARPFQMGPVWMQVSEITKVKINHLIWMQDPPSSSYPACIAFKCAELQSAQAGEDFLCLLREAVMLLGQNISKTDILLTLAANSVMAAAGFSRSRFKEDLHSGAGLEAFRRDLQLSENHRITRFPTLVIRRTGRLALQVSGFKKFDELIAVIGPL